MKSILTLTLAAGLATACSQGSSQQSTTKQDAASPPAQSAASTPPPASTPAPPTAAPEPAAPPPAAADPAPAPSAPPSSAAPPVATSGSPASTPVAAATSPPARAPAPPPEPPPPPEPQFREVVIPAGTSLSIKVLSTLASDASHVEDPVKGALAQPVKVSGMTAIPAGAEISGSVVEVNESKRVKGKASIAFAFDRLTVRGETHRIQTARVAQEAARDKKSDIKKGGVGGGLGAVVGGVVGGGKGAAIGAVAGGTAAVMGTKGDEVKIEPGTIVTALLQQSVTLTVPIK